MTNRKANTNCFVCGTKLYRRPSDLKRNKRSYCQICLKEDKTGASKRDRNFTRYNNYIERWKRGEEDGMRGKTSISIHIRKYLFIKYENKCCRCGWSEINPFTLNIPLEVEHLDGDYKNNKEENLELVCPNCHSLTSTYRSLNVGNGRPR